MVFDLILPNNAALCLLRYDAVLRHFSTSLRYLKKFDLVKGIERHLKSFDLFDVILLDLTLRHYVV